MQKINLSPIVLIVSTLCSCCDTSKELEDTTEKQTIRFELGSVANSGTGHFAMGDQIGIQAYSTDRLLGVATYQLKGSEFMSDTPLYEKDLVNLESYVAIYPDSFGEKHQFIFTAGTDQSNAVVTKQSDLLIAKTKQVDAFSPRLDFKHALSSIVMDVKVTRSGKPFAYSKVRFHAKLRQQCDLLEGKYEVCSEAPVCSITPRKSAEVEDRYSVVLASQQFTTAGFATLETTVDQQQSVIKMADEVLEEIKINSGEQQVYRWEIELEPLSQRITKVSGSIEGWIENEEIQDSVISPEVGGDIEDWEQGGGFDSDLSVTTPVYDWDGISIPVAAPQGTTWVLDEAISDDFNYSSKNDGFFERWTDFYHNPWTGPAPTYWEKEHVEVAGGNLRIKATRPSDAALLRVQSGNQSKQLPATHTGCITSKHQVVYPVYVEARAQLSNSTMASDIWMLSPDDTQEIDILEAYGGDRDRGLSGKKFYGKEHLHLSHHVFIRSPFADYQPTSPATWYSRKGTKWRDDFHRIGVYWKDPWSLAYYVDGVKVRTVPTHEIDPKNYTQGTGLSKPMDIIINMEDQSWRAIDGLSPTTAELSDEANTTFKVDWIRVYRNHPVNP